MVVQAEIRTVPFTLAGRTAVVIYNTTHTNARFIKVAQDADGTIYLAGVEGTNLTADTVICKSSISTQVLIGPIGCDNPSDPSNSVEASNCAKNDQEATINKETLQSSFWLSAESSACLANSGDKFSCLGPIWIIFAETQLPKDNLKITPADLLGSQGVCIISGFGPRCEGPMVTWLDIVLPFLIVKNTTCEDDGGTTFEGNFLPFYQDNGNYHNETIVFRREVNTRTQRVTILRAGDDTVTEFRFGLVSATGSGEDLFLLEHLSLATFPTDWLLDLPFQVQFDSGCNATFASSSPATTSFTEFTLNEPLQLDDINYYKNELPPRFNKASECNIHLGVLDKNGLLKYPFTLEGHYGGGEYIWSTPGLVGKPLQIDADLALKDYVTDDCSSLWPSQLPFAGYGTNGTNGAIQEPYRADPGLCFSPFLDVALILDNDGRDEARYLDCFKQGAFVYSITKDCCFRPVQDTRCQLGWTYYHQHCYFKFDITKHGKYQTVDAFADDLCKQLDDKATSLRRVTRDIRAYLQRFVLYQRQPGFPYRINVEGKLCEAYDVDPGSGDSFDDDIAIVYDINCDTVPAFPVCRYHVKDHRIPYSEFALSANTIRVLRDGQEGVPHVGREVECRCYTGWGNRGCTSATCGFPAELVGRNDTLSRFFQKCYANNRGTCDHMNPRFCKCYEGYGPPAHLLQDQVFVDFPCAFPAYPEEEPESPIVTGSIINGVFYPGADLGICGGSNRGEGIVDKSLNFGVCKCKLRQNLDPKSLVKFEPANDGQMCSGVVPMIAANQFQLNGDNVERFCNGRGTVCPTGERYPEQRLDETYFTMMGRDVCRLPNGKMRVGCVCDDGWTGSACTSPVPKNQLQAILYPMYDRTQTAYQLLKVRKSIAKVVNMEPTICTITQVFVQDTNNGLELACNQTSAPTEWLCQAETPVTKVIITSVQNVLQCRIKAFHDTFNICGNHPLITAARFFANEFYRSYTKYELPQSSKFAPFGSTITECMCDADHTGPLCSYGVSGLRWDYDLSGFHKEICGSVTLPPRGSLGVNGCQCNNVDGGLMVARFTEKACEIPEVYILGQWYVCSNRGRGVLAKFPTGKCAFDVGDLSRDTLLTPFFGVNPAVTSPNSFLYMVSPISNVTTGALIWVNEAFWYFPSGTKLFLDTLSLPGLAENQSASISFGSPNVPLPLNLTYFCAGVLPLPQRASVLVELWYLTFTCDPEEHYPDELACYSTTKNSSWTITKLQEYPFCSSIWQTAINVSAVTIPIYACIHRIIAPILLLDEEQALETGFYPSVALFYGNLVPGTNLSTTQTERSFAYGVFDCSNPIDRILADVAWALGLVLTRQCADQGVVPHSHVLGEGYGIFQGYIPGLEFTISREWNAGEVEFIRSMLVGKVCVSSDDSDLYIHEAFDGRVFDTMTKSWYTGIPLESSDRLNSSQLTLVRKSGFNLTAWKDTGFSFGNPFTQQSYLLTGSLTNKFVDKRPGYFVEIPIEKDQFVRKIVVNISIVGVTGVQLYGPRGQLCFTSFAFPTFKVGDLLEITCGDTGFSGEEEWVTMLRFQELFPTNQTKVNELVAAYQSSSPYQTIILAWTSVEFPYSTGTFKGEDIQLYSRSVEYTGLFESLKRQILVNHTFPEHTAYSDSCLAHSGRVLRDIEIPRDLNYLKALHATHLAQRPCTDTLQCQKFARDATNYQCVYDFDFAKAWSGSDPDIPTAFVGEEGGCDCNVGFSDPQLHCSQCIHGYGPGDDQDWARYREMNLILNVSSALVTEYCASPWDVTSLRENKICGGRGDLVLNTYTNTFRARIFQPGNLTRRCLGVRYNGNLTNVISLVTGEDDYDLNLIRYIGLTHRVEVIGDNVFVNDERKFVTLFEQNRLHFTDGTTLDCVGVDDSTTHHLTLVNRDRNNETERVWLDSSIHFFIAKL
jgi:hypothetical protein